MLKNIFRFISLLFCTLTCTLGVMSPVSALEAGDIVMQVQPADQEIELIPGQSYLAQVHVSNIGRLPFTFTVSASPYQVLNENYDPDFVTENNYTKLSNWIVFPEDEFRLEAGESCDVPFVIVVPKNIPGGGQYAAIMIETRDSMSESASVGLISRLASYIYAHVEGEEHVGGVIMSQSLPNVLLGSPFSAKVTVKNDGNVDFRVDHSLTIYDFFTNREVFSPNAVDANGKTPGHANPAILPGTQRTNVLTWEGAPQLGIFRAVQTISFLDQSTTTEKVVIICPIWLAGGIVFLILLMIIWLVVRHRRRERSRPQVF